MELYCGAVARLFFDLVDGAISLLQTLATAMDTIFGSNLSGTLQGWRDELSGWVENKFDKGEEIMEKVKASDYYLDRIKYSDAYNKGYNFGEGIEDKLSSLGKFGEGDIPKVEEYQNYQSSLLDSESEHRKYGAEHRQYGGRYGDQLRGFEIYPGYGGTGLY